MDPSGRVPDIRWEVTCRRGHELRDREGQVAEGRIIGPVPLLPIAAGAVGDLAAPQQNEQGSGPRGGHPGDT